MAKRSPTTSRSNPLAAPRPEHRVVLLKGADVFLQGEHTAALRTALKQEHGEIDVQQHTGSTVDAADVLDECRSFGLMAPYKLVIVDDAEDLLASEDRRGLLERYAAAPSDAATLVLRGVTKRFPRLEKIIAEHGVVADCSTPTEPFAIQWATERAASHHGGSIKPDAARVLVSRLGPDLGRLDGEIAKLATASAGEPISAGLVAQLVSGSREENAFAIHGDLLSGNPERAVHAVRGVLDSAPRDAHVPVGIAAMQAAKQVHADVAGNTRARPEHSAAAKRLLDAAMLADVENKSTGGDPVRRLEVLAIRFARFSRWMASRR